MRLASFVHIVPLIAVALGTLVPHDSTAEALPEAHTQGSHEQIVRSGMAVLGGWAGANIAAGLTGRAIREDPELRGFWEMNALWNTVNLALAGGTLVAQSRRSDPTGSTELTLPQYREASHRLEKVLLFNAGLDVGYMALGGWLWERGTRGYGVPASGISPERLTGWGQSLVLQGAFLFVFDVVLARALARDRQRQGRP